MKKFLNISNHVLTKEQIDGLEDLILDKPEVIELPADLKAKWGQLNPDNYHEVCHEIYLFAKENGIRHCHLAGFMPAVVCMSKAYPLFLYYSFSERVSEEKEVDGKIVKTSVFKHKSWHQYYMYY